MGEEHQYDVRMSRRVFPTASAGAASLRADASRPITSSRPEFGDIAERTLRWQLTEDGNVKIRGRELRECSRAPGVHQCTAMAKITPTAGSPS